jgi:hypothetical protein
MPVKKYFRKAAAVIIARAEKKYFLHAARFSERPFIGASQAG